MKKALPPKQGFTLVELLIVITIIAILTIIGIVNYSSFNRSARDSKRQSDLKIIQSALEAYHADKIYYPASIPSVGQFAAGNKIYLNEVPEDPLKPRQFYHYVAKDDTGSSCTGDSCTKYCLYAKLEDRVPDSDDGCSPSDPSYNYGVTRP